MTHSQRAHAKKVYVVMGNDYPGAVFTTERAAEKHCEIQRKVGQDFGRKIYWRVYEFELDKPE